MINFVKTVLNHFQDDAPFTDVMQYVVNLRLKNQPCTYGGLYRIVVNSLGRMLECHARYQNGFVDLVKEFSPKHLSYLQ